MIRKLLISRTMDSQKKIDVQSMTPDEMRLLVEYKELNRRSAEVKRRIQNVAITSPLHLAEKSVSDIQLEISFVDHQMAALRAEAPLNDVIKERKMKSIWSEECKKVELQTKKNQAAMVLEKEEKTLAIHCEKIHEVQSLGKGRVAREGSGIARAKESELRRVELLKDEIQRIYDSEELAEDVDKLKQDVMILKKRNAALLLRLKKRAEEQHRSRSGDLLEL